MSSVTVKALHREFFYNGIVGAGGNGSAVLLGLRSPVEDRRPGDVRAIEPRAGRGAGRFW